MAYLTLDDFTTGQTPMVASTANLTKQQTGHGIIGGTRELRLSIVTGNPLGLNNPFMQPVQVEVRPSTGPDAPSALIWSAGYGAFSRIDMLYGNNNPLKLNLNPTHPGAQPYNRFRFNFAGLSTSEGLDLVLLVLGANTTTWAESGAGSLGGTAIRTPFTVDFPFSKFVMAASETVEWVDIQSIWVIFQPGALAYPPDLAVTGFYAVPVSDTSVATFTVGTNA